MEEVTMRKGPIFVMGCPRSGTTFVTDWIGKVCSHTIQEDLRFPVEAAAQWELPSLDCVLKWGHIFQKADVLIARWPHCRFVHVVRRPLDVLYSITHPTEQSQPFRDFGDMRDADKAVQWWSFHIQGCQQVASWYRRNTITVEYENLPEEKSRLDTFLGISLPPLSDFRPRGYGDLRLVWWGGHLQIEKGN